MGEVKQFPDQRQQRDGSDLAEVVAEAQQALDEACSSPLMSGEPYRAILLSQQKVLGVFPALVQAIRDAAGQNQPAATLTDKQFCEFSHRARCDLVEVLKLQLRPVTWKPIVHGVLGGLALAAACFGGGVWWQSSHSQNTQLWANAAYAECKKHVTTDKSGQRMCILAMSVD